MNITYFTNLKNKTMKNLLLKTFGVIVYAMAVTLVIFGIINTLKLI